MSQPLIVLRDATDHGGTVIGAAPYATTNGKRIARVGDMVSCPRCKGIFPITQGNQSMTFDGAAAAYHGCAVACGAKLIASQALMTTDPSGELLAGIDHGNGKDHAQRFGTVGSGLAAAYEDKLIDQLGKRFQGRFQVVSEDGGQPVSGQTVRVRSTGGQYVTGVTDAQGYTQWVERDAAEMLAFDIVSDGKA